MNQNMKRTNSTPENKKRRGSTCCPMGWIRNKTAFEELKFCEAVFTNDGTKHFQFRNFYIKIEQVVPR